MALPLITKHGEEPPVRLASIVALSERTDWKPPLGAAVPDEGTARAIAQAVIAARPVKLKEYSLKLVRSGDGWDAAQSRATTPPVRKVDGQVIAMLGGGGLHMHIDRCTGEISNMYYVR